VRSRAVIAGIVGVLIAAIAIGGFVALRADDDGTPSRGTKDVPLADLHERDALIAISDANVGQVTKIRNALDASANVVAYTEVRPGVANEINAPGLTGGPAQCEASGFIVDLAPSVDPNEFASTLPKGADVLDWKTVTSGSSYEPQTFDRLVAGPYVLVMLAPDATAQQIATIKTAPTVVRARELTDEEYLATFPAAQRDTVPRPLPRVLDLQLKLGVPANPASEAFAHLPGVTGTVGRELSCDAAVEAGTG
jgi:hypothetical protein